MITSNLCSVCNQAPYVKMWDFEAQKAVRNHVARFRHYATDLKYGHAGLKSNPHVDYDETSMADPDPMCGTRKFVIPRFWPTGITDEKCGTDECPDKNCHLRQKGA
jgi:hypothetical protein